MTYPRVKISSYCKVVSGSTPKRNVPEYWNGNILWTTPKDISKLTSPYLYDTPDKISQKGYKSCSTNLLPKGSVLLSSRAPIGLVAIAGRDMCTNQGFKSLVPGNAVDSLYLYYCIKSMKDQIVSMGSGTTFKEISKEVLSALEIPLPPLDVQRKIAAVLDKADRLRQLRKAAIEKLDQLTQSVFLDMFGDPVTNPKGWEVKKLNNLIDNIDSGWSPKSEDFPAKGDNWGILKLSAVTRGIYLPEENKALSSKLKPIEAIEVKKGDVLFTRKNTRDLIAACAFVHSTPIKLMLPDTIFRFKIHAYKSLIINGYLWGVFSNRKFRKTVQHLAGGSAGSMPNISKTKLLNLDIPLPPITLQKKFLSIIEQIYSLRERLFFRFNCIDNLFNSLLQRAFRGELDLNDHYFDKLSKETTVET